MNQSNLPIKVIYILSSGHSGSTLLDLLLGSHSQIESLGEIEKFNHYFPNTPNALTTLSPEKRICTCGSHVKNCEYWARVKAAIQENGHTFNIDLKDSNHQRFSENNHILMGTILNVTQKSIICDSSKSYSRLQSLMKSDLFEVFVLHLVRDGRAVAFSKKQKETRIDSAKSDQIQKYFFEIPTYYKVIKNWSSQNEIFHQDHKHSRNYYCIKYEDLTRDPVKCISAFLKQVNLSFESDQLNFSQFPHHNIGGNRMRRKTGQKIKNSSGYVELLSQREWWLGTFLGIKGLKKFGYCFKKTAQSLD